jgi:hypothetical protein
MDEIWSSGRARKAWRRVRTDDRQSNRQTGTHTGRGIRGTGRIGSLHVKSGLTCGQLKKPQVQYNVNSITAAVRLYVRPNYRATVSTISHEHD